MQTSRRITADLTTGELTESLKALQSAGMYADEFARIGNSSTLCTEVMEVFLKRRFTPPEDQIQILFDINEHVWKDSAITQKVIRALPAPWARLENNRNHLYCYALLYETGDPVLTFKQNCRAMVYALSKHQINAYHSNIVSFSPRIMSQRAAGYSRKQGLQWAIVELGRSIPLSREFDVTLLCSAPENMGLGQELPLIAALHPDWVRSLNGVTVPFICAPDLHISVGQRTYMPCLQPENAGIELGARPFGCYDDPIYGIGSFHYVQCAH